MIDHNTKFDKNQMKTRSSLFSEIVNDGRSEISKVISCELKGHHFHPIGGHEISSDSYQNMYMQDDKHVTITALGSLVNFNLWIPLPLKVTNLIFQTL